MRRTDYTDVAPRYEQSAWRSRVALDPVLLHRVETAQGKPLTVLDLGCGTGNYLAAHEKALEGRAVRFIGLDPSESMLGFARPKLNQTELVVGHAESLPFDDGAIDYLTSSFAFHHFENKPKALDEWARVLSPTGVLRVVNIDPERMMAWWVYRYFPEAVLEDQKRFWSSALFFRELTERGLVARLRVEIDCYCMSPRVMLPEAQLREMSQLAILTDAEFQRGIQRLAADAAIEPCVEIPTELALMTCVAERRPG